MIRHHKLPAIVAIAGTAGICSAAFVLSFAALCDLAARSGVTVAWLWPTIVDGLIVVATVAVVAGAGRYAWCLLGAGALVSVAGNVLHAALPDGVLPVWLRATVAAVPPIALVAVAHLAVVLRRAERGLGVASREEATNGSDEQLEESTTDARKEENLSRGNVARNAKDSGLRLLRDGAHPDSVAEQVGVHRTTVYRWRRELGVAL